jgi:hypothetical protein
MKHLVMIIATQWVAAGFVVLAASPATAQDSDDQRLALAQRIVELQRLQEFHEQEWEFQLEAMREYMPDGMELEDFMPAHMLEVMREQQVDGQIEEWVNVLADSLDASRLAEIAGVLESPAYQNWQDEQLRLHPDYLTRLSERMHAVGEVMVEEMSDDAFEFDFPEPEHPTLDDVPPIEDEALAALFGVAPGSRVEHKLDSSFGQSVRVPASHATLRSQFSDLEVRLVPDGEHARVGSISAQRSFNDEDACESARDALDASLADHFDDTRTNDCGHQQHLSANGDIRLTIRCREPNALGGVTLSLSVSHQPTRDAQFSAMRAWADADEEPAIDE